MKEPIMTISNHENKIHCDIYSNGIVLFIDDETNTLIASFPSAN